MDKNISLLPQELIEKKIYVIRGQKVMLSIDLANLYEVEPRSLIQAVKRNKERFPDDFMFPLSVKEYSNLKSQIVISSWGGRRFTPYAFTEQGVAMLSSVLKSEGAVLVNIQIMRAFVNLCRIGLTYAGLKRKIEAMENKYDSQFKIVFGAIKKLLEPPEPRRKKIGFCCVNGDTKT
jgi:hypothetical protein